MVKFNRLSRIWNKTMYSRCYFTSLQIINIYNPLSTLVLSTLPELLHIKHLAKCLTHSKCPINSIYYFYCLPPLINHNVNKADKIRKKIMKEDLFIHWHIPALFNHVIIYYYTTLYLILLLYMTILHTAWRINCKIVIALCQLLNLKNV